MLFFFTVAVLLASAQAKFYTDCGSKLGSVVHVEVGGCAQDAKECILKRNTNATMNIDFTPSVDVKSVMTEVHGVIMGLPVPFPMPQPDACKDNGLVCPLKAGEEFHYRATLPVLKSYPKVKVEVKWELKNEDAVDVKSVMTEVHGVIMGLPVPFPMPQPDACKDNGLVCPLKAGEEFHYRATLPVLKSYPKVKVEVKWELKNEDGEDLVCILVPAKIN